jgi:RNA ligase (TIGR02306 family)
MRQLASIQKIKSLEPIENADVIEKATVLGWQLVTKKGDFAVGDLCVYCEVDSLLPEKPEFAFLKPKNMRIRTVRLRGQISQGICFPLSVLPAGTPVEEGLDVTAVLGVEKYEPPIPASLAGLVKGAFPSFIPKTDETRVQVLQELLDKYAGELCYVTEKLDGSSVTYYLKDNEFGICSRNLELLETPENSLWKVARMLDIENKLRSLGGNFALQGELFGEGIQGNKYNQRGQTAYFFNVFNIDTHAYVNFADFQEMLTKLALPMVPVLNTAFRLSNNIPALVELSKMRSTLNPVVWAEGIVIRPLTEKQDKIGRVSFKAINPEFLLKYE